MTVASGIPAVVRRDVFVKSTVQLLYEYLHCVLNHPASAAAEKRL